MEIKTTREIVRGIYHGSYKWVSVESLLEHLDDLSHDLCGVNCATCQLIDELTDQSK